MMVRRALMAAPLAILIWAAAIYFGSRSEGFRFFENKIRESSAMQQRVGTVQGVTLPVFGMYRDKLVGSDEWVKMLFDVEVSRDKVRVRAALQKINGVWTITESSIDGRNIDLN